MKPIAIFRHASTEGPGYLTAFLDRRMIPLQLIRIDAGDPLPVNVTNYSGLVFMGGPMSVNDNLPWIPPVLQLIQQAVAAGIPVLGHCLGGQLMSKALGGVVTKNAVKEIGWGEVQVSRNFDTFRWFGEVSCFEAFHWHGETFSIPAGAINLLESKHCAHQAFSMGKHIAFQCHIEMTIEMVSEWCRIGADEITAAANSPGVQPASEIERDIISRVTTLNAVADHVYSAWVEGLVF